MKTAMQEMLEWVRATLPMDLDTPILIEQKIGSLIEKEKTQMIEFAQEVFRNRYNQISQSLGNIADDIYNETYKNK